MERARLSLAPRTFPARCPRWRIRLLVDQQSQLLDLPRPAGDSRPWTSMGYDGPLFREASLCPLPYRCSTECCPYLRGQTWIAVRGADVHGSQSKAPALRFADYSLTRKASTRPVRNVSASSGVGEKTLPQSGAFPPGKILCGAVAVWSVASVGHETVPGSSHCRLARR